VKKNIQRKDSGQINTRKESSQDEASNPINIQKATLKDLLKNEAAQKKMLKQKKRSNPTHPLYFKGFKGFADGVTDFDVQNNGNVVVASSIDKSFRVFKSKDIDDQNPASVVQKIDFNFPTGISISQDCKTVAISLDNENSVKVYSLTGLGKYDDEDAKITIDLESEFPKALHKTTIHSIFLDKEAKFVVTSSEENDTTIKAWNKKGDNLATFNNNQLKNYKFVASENGKFIGVASWAPDTRILELKTNKDGSFKSISKAMELKGHRLSVLSLGFNHATDRAATVSKDNSVKIWNIDVRYEMSEDPKCLQTIDFANEKELISKSFYLIAMHYNSQENINLIALAYESNILIYDLNKEKVVEDIGQAHNEGHKLTKLLFKFIKANLYLYSSGEDGRVNMWKLN